MATNNNDSNNNFLWMSALVTLVIGVFSLAVFKLHNWYIGKKNTAQPESEKIEKIQAATIVEEKKADELTLEHESFPSSPIVEVEEERVAELLLARQLRISRPSTPSSPLFIDHSPVGDSESVNSTAIGAAESVLEEDDVDAPPPLNRMLSMAIQNVGYRSGLQSPLRHADTESTHVATLTATRMEQQDQVNGL